ncbi:hypothetical protein TSAR_005126, partial [Trichomalopsis sarcophagae]
MVGDNLGSHQIGGFTQKFSSPKEFCRYCNLTMEEFLKDPFHTKVLRTKKSYKKDAADAMGSNSIVYGVKFNSILNQLKYFHVIFGLPPCVAHDVFEGELLILLVAIYDFIKDFDNNVWNMILKLRQISIFNVFPTLRPKHHYVMHYPELIQMFGPLKHLSIENNFYSSTDIKSAFEYTPENCDSEIVKAIDKYFKDKSVVVKYICLKITHRKINYSNDMKICTHLNEYGNLMVCNIHAIIIDNIFNIDKIIYFPELGIYERANYQTRNNLTNDLLLFPLTSLFCPHPLLESKIKSVPTILSQASRFFKINSAKIVTESDGFPIQNKDTIQCLSDQVFMILEDNDVWTASEKGNENNQNVTNQQEEAASPCKMPQQSDSCEANDSGNIVPNFDFDLIQNLKSGIRTKRIQKYVLNGIIDELRIINHHIPDSVLKSVADTLIAIYPKTFTDLWKDGKRQGDGTVTVISKMRNRNNYLNRPHMDSNNLSRVLQLPFKKTNIRVGCPKWQPEHYNADVTNEIAENHRQYLFHYKEYDEADDEILRQCTDALADSFPLQRLFLNKIENSPCVAEIQETWPCLFNQLYTTLHFSLLTNYNYNDLIKEMKEDIPILLQYGHFKQLVDMDELQTDNQKNLAVITVTFQHFNEKFQSLFLTSS